MPPIDLKTARILVAGATGGVGQLTVAKLMAEGLVPRVLTRRPQLARRLFGEAAEVVVGNTLEPETLPSAMVGITHVICCTGTTAFPSERWQFPEPESLADRWRIYGNPQQFGEIARNSPQKVDANGVQNLVQAAPANLQRFVFVSSCGVRRRQQFPFNILNGFGVLDAKWVGETAIANSGLPYTIIRPGRLIDGPFTSYDLNTLLQAKTDGQRGIVVAPGDVLAGDTSRIDVAAACVECLRYPDMAGKQFAIANQGPRPETIAWDTLFAQL